MAAKKKRIKKTTPVLRTRAEMENTVAKIAILKNEETVIKAQIDAQVIAIKEKFEDRLGEIQELLGLHMEAAEVWADTNPGEFAKRKSIDMVHGLVGFRTGTPKLKTARGYTWDKVLDLLKGLPEFADYIRTKVDVDKAAIINDREQLGPEGLKRMAVKVVQEEAFFIEPKLNEQENRITAADFSGQAKAA
ncbi:MAG: host-nuclease inhibitor Gam family protein [Rhodospirillaceae bacterium]